MKISNALKYYISNTPFEAAFKTRLLLVGCFLCIAFLILSYRLILTASDPYIRNTYELTKNDFRKEVVDRNNQLLALNLPSFSLFANIKKIRQARDSLNKLSKILPQINTQKLLSEFNNKHFVWIARGLTLKEKTEIFNLGLIGFEFEKEQKRIYPFGNLTSHIIGYVGRDFRGLTGLEKSYDEFLATNTMSQIQQYNKEGAKCMGNTQELTEEVMFKNGTWYKGKNLDVSSPLRLSIDIRLQNILNEELEKTIKAFSAIGGVGIIANPNNGEILAAVSKPDFDPHDYQKATQSALFNMSSLGALEMGSIFKNLTLAIAYDTKTITSRDAYDITYMKVGKFVIKDTHPKTGWHTVPEIFLHSSNIGVGQIILEVGQHNFKKYLKNLGLLDQLKIELPERAIPYRKKTDSWNDLSLITMSYGYGLSISPMHFMQAMLPIVNGGYFYPLTLICQNDSKVKSQNINRVFDESTSNEMLKLMRLVVTHGTGKKADISGYCVGGKTGTAYKANKGRYDNSKRISSFFGVLPASKPQYAILIIIDEPKGNKETFGFATGGWTAAPTVKRVFERMITLYGLDKVKDTDMQELTDIDFKMNNEV